ncbi:MAG: hypothetical protein M0C28_30385 [Candidatus Moduliflexus flocculans]|nr:hypothetical protein [Candidatus Moduliflexus flocculans]
MVAIRVQRVDRTYMVTAKMIAVDTGIIERRGLRGRGGRGLGPARPCRGGGGRPRRDREETRRLRGPQARLQVSGPGPGERRGSDRHVCTRGSARAVNSSMTTSVPEPTSR